MCVCVCVCVCVWPMVCFCCYANMANEDVLHIFIFATEDDAFSGFSGSMPVDDKYIEVIRYWLCPFDLCGACCFMRLC